MIKQRTLRSEINGFVVKQFVCDGCNEKIIVTKHMLNVDLITKANMKVSKFTDSHKDCKDRLR